MNVKGLGDSSHFMKAAFDGHALSGSAQVLKHLIESTPLRVSHLEGGNSIKVAALLSEPRPLPTTTETRTAVLKSTILDNETPQLDWTAAQWRAHDRKDFFDPGRWEVLAGAGLTAFGGGVLGWAVPKLLTDLTQPQPASAPVQRKRLVKH